jgi:chromosome segregation ATPase
MTDEKHIVTNLKGFNALSDCHKRIAELEKEMEELKTSVVDMRDKLMLERERRETTEKELLKLREALIKTHEIMKTFNHEKAYEYLTHKLEQLAKETPAEVLPKCTECGCNLCVGYPRAR